MLESTGCQFSALTPLCRNFFLCNFIFFYSFLFLILSLVHLQCPSPLITHMKFVMYIQLCLPVNMLSFTGLTLWMLGSQMIFKPITILKSSALGAIWHLRVVMRDIPSFCLVGISTRAFFPGLNNGTLTLCTHPMLSLINGSVYSLSLQFIIISYLSNDRSRTSSKMIPPHSAI